MDCRINVKRVRWISLLDDGLMDRFAGCRISDLVEFVGQNCGDGLVYSCWMAYGTT